MKTIHIPTRRVRMESLARRGTQRWGVLPFAGRVLELPTGGETAEQVCQAMEVAWQGLERDEKEAQVSSCDA